jgi:ATP/maltotriose-dependent transcriptional regulator MalT
MTTTTPPTLSYREWQILELLANGKSNKEIADELAIAVHTVETHLRNVYRKLAVTKRVGACQWYWAHQQYWKNTGNP